ncbi:MAG: hypothetical protein WCD43_17935 [Candidatus Acidiferrales bacterium]
MATSEIDGSMGYQSSKTQDANLGLALIVSLVCGVTSFWCSFEITIRFMFLSGLVKVHILYPAQSTFEGISAVFVCLGLSLLFGILVARLMFRVIIRWVKISGPVK